MVNMPPNKENQPKARTLGGAWKFHKQAIFLRDRTLPEIAQKNEATANDPSVEQDQMLLSLPSIGM